jgi:hypothetical protein
VVVENIDYHQIGILANKPWPVLLRSFSCTLKVGKRSTTVRVQSRMPYEPMHCAGINLSDTCA